jgi:glutamate---cysteine ligase / carboxylate-amine ligase
LVPLSGPRPTAQTDRYAHRFGSSPPLSLGIEEELLLVDAELAPAADAEAVIDAVSGLAGERVSTEIFSEQIEVKTGVCLGVTEALAQLRETRGEVAGAGFGLLGSGLHPASTGRVRLVSKPRYEVVKEDLGKIILSTPPCGLHVHVGMPDPEAAVRIANAFRRYLPVLTALSANSPFHGGADSGHASARTTVVRAYPRFQVPRAFRDYEDFCRVADELIAAAGVDDYTYIWWDVRPHPKLGTVEVRAVDVQADAVTSVALAALIQAIAARELEQPSGAGHSREALEESYFQAASHGLGARILLDGEAPEPALDVARQVLDASRPYARELGADAALEELERVLRDGNGADEQRRVHAEQGMPALLRHLAARTR